MDEKGHLATLIQSASR